MITLKNILPKSLRFNAVGALNVEVAGLTFDSRAVTPGFCFFAIRGTQVDGHQFIAAAVDKGASAVVCEQMPAEVSPGVTYIRVDDAPYTLGLMASAFYGNPSEKLRLIGITGTNGKTTTATLLYRLVGLLGHRAGLLSTVTNCIGNTRLPATHTTPDQIQLNALLAQMVDEGCDYCFMEVSSHSVVQKRIAGLTFCGGVFTNITHDHLDYHKTFDEYIRAKKRFFDNLPASAFAITNADDRNGMVMLQNTKSSTKTYSLRSMADVRCRIVESHFDGTLLQLDGVEVWTRLVGEFNAYNLLAIYTALTCLGFDKGDVLTRLSEVTAVAGRFECIRSGSGVVAIVDYAHTPDALQNVAEAIRKIKNSDQRLITVVGAGGNRDKTKRPLMARVAAELSDMAVLTSDNPRFEEPEDILNDMKAGVDIALARRVITITDRREAIRTACLMAKKGDIVLVAGKGHESYQEVKGVKHHFDDREVVSEIFNTL